MKPLADQTNGTQFKNDRQIPVIKNLRAHGNLR